MTKTQNKNSFEFTQVIEHEGKLYLSMELMISKTIQPKDIKRMTLDKEFLIRALNARLQHCREKLQGAIKNGRIIRIDGTDNTHIYYETGDKVESYSLIAANAMRDTIIKLKACPKCFIDGKWVVETLEALQIQQIIKALEELISNDDEKDNVLNYLNCLHESYVFKLTVEKPEQFIRTRGFDRPLVHQFN